MRILGAFGFVALALVLSVHPATADQPPPSLNVSGSGSVTYSPDIARVSLGVRAESPSAATAAKSVNGRAQAVVAALRKLGIADADIRTSGYSIQYQPPQPQPQPMPMEQNVVAPAPPPGQAGFPGEIRRPIPGKGTYVATESIDVKSGIDKAGAVLDAGLAAGADETYGVSFDTSNRDALYRQALSRAVASARAQAAVIARAAGVSIVGVQSLSAGGGVAPMPMMMRMAPGGPPPIMGGTGTVEASVEISYRIK